MKRDFDKYAELGNELIKDSWQYGLSLDETREAVNIFDKSMNKRHNKFDAAIDVAMYFYHAGIETGRRYEKNRSKRK